MDQRDSQHSAPLALLVFNRPEVTQRVVERAVAANPRAVYLIADGPRVDHPSDVQLCASVRTIVSEAGWQCPVHTLFSETNMGLKARVSSGLDWVFDQELEAIILEDDCLADPSFFPFAAQLLSRYAPDDRVGIISGNNFLRGHRVSDDSYYFSPDVRIWGWATWARTWKDFSQSGLHREWTAEQVEAVVGKISNPRRRAAVSSMAQQLGSLDSWALPFVLHCQERGYLNVVPQVNLVANVGFGRDSTHTKFESFTDDIAESRMAWPLRHPAEVVEPRGAGELEGRLESREWLTYPLRHPFDFLGRVWRYFRR